MTEATPFGRPQRRARTPPTSAWSTPSSRRSRWMRSSGVRAPLWTWLRVAGVGVHEDELADVVQQRRDHQAVAVLVADLGGEPVGGALRRDAVQAEALGRGVPDGRALEEVEGARPRGERLRRPRARAARRPRRPTRPCRGSCPRPGWPRRSTAITSATSDSTAATTSPVRDALLLDEAQQAVAGLGQRRERLERLEGGGQAAAVALVVAARTRREDPGRECSMERRRVRPWCRRRASSSVRRCGSVAPLSARGRMIESLI